MENDFKEIEDKDEVLSLAETLNPGSVPFINYQQISCNNSQSNQMLDECLEIEKLTLALHFWAVKCLLYFGLYFISQNITKGMFYYL